MSECKHCGGCVGCDLEADLNTAKEWGEGLRVENADLRQRLQRYEAVVTAARGLVTECQRVMHGSNPFRDIDDLEEPTVALHQALAALEVE